MLLPAFGFYDVACIGNQITGHDLIIIIVVNAVQ